MQIINTKYRQIQNDYNIKLIVNLQHLIIKILPIFLKRKTIETTILQIFRVHLQERSYSSAIQKR